MAICFLVLEREEVGVRELNRAVRAHRSVRGKGERRACIFDFYEDWQTEYRSFSFGHLRERVKKQEKDQTETREEKKGGGSRSPFSFLYTTNLRRPNLD